MTENKNKTSRGLRVLSLCGGVETGLYALQQLDIPIEEYHTYEILPLRFHRIIFHLLYIMAIYMKQILNSLKDLI